MLETWMDRLWLVIVAAVHKLVAIADAMLGPVDRVMGPAVSILLVAAITYLVSRGAGRLYRPRRLVRLQQRFAQGMELRQQAIGLADEETGRLLARHIDQAELNRTYYDLFFEQLMVSLLTRYLPFFIALAYVNEAYRPEVLLQRFGTPHLFALPTGATTTVGVGGLLWFVVCYLHLVAAAWLLGRVRGRRRPGQVAAQRRCGAVS